MSCCTLGMRKGLMNSARNVAIILAASACVAACSTPYKPNLVGKPAARARFVSDHPIAAHAGVLKRNCVAMDAIGWDTSIERIGVVAPRKPDVWQHWEAQRIGIPAPPANPNAIFIEQALPAQEPIALGFYASNAGMGMIQVTCSAGVTFTPETGADYELHFTGTMGLRPTCRVTLRQLVRRDGALTYIDVVGAKFAPRC